MSAIAPRFPPARRSCAAVAQLVRAPVCGTGGRWFKSTQLYQFPHASAWRFLGYSRHHVAGAAVALHAEAHVQSILHPLKGNLKTPHREPPAYASRPVSIATLALGSMVSRSGGGGGFHRGGGDCVSPIAGGMRHGGGHRFGRHSNFQRFGHSRFSRVNCRASWCSPSHRRFGSFGHNQHRFGHRRFTSQHAGQRHQRFGIHGHFHRRHWSWGGGSRPMTLPARPVR